MSKPRLIAFYLPQFYPTKENDEWWEPGFTEWTNVARAKPLFHGHYQPKIPRDLGFYDLRVPETREKQVQLAREAGIEGFCYWHYWFAGKRLLDKVFREIVESGKPDFPFCLCWANHSWYKKTWDPTTPNTLLIEQTYPGEKDYISHFYAMLPAFKDPRYMKVHGKLIFATFAYSEVPDMQLFKNTWNRLAKENGLEGFYFIGMAGGYFAQEDVLKRGYDAACIENLTSMNFCRSKTNKFLWRVIHKFTHIPRLIKFDDTTKYFNDNYTASPNIHPVIVPNFDHSPRSQHRGVIIPDSSPQKWKQMCLNVFRKASTRLHEENIVFIKAWNEWGEGNYLEPDQKHGMGYINTTREALGEFDKLNH